MIEGNVTAHAESAGRILILVDELRALFGQMQTELPDTAPAWGANGGYDSAQIHADLQSAHVALDDIAATVTADEVPHP